MKLEIVEPGLEDMGPVESKGKIRVWCECTHSDPCPQRPNRSGMFQRCSIWLDPKMLSDSGIKTTNAMNTYDR